MCPANIFQSTDKLKTRSQKSFDAVLELDLPTAEQVGLSEFAHAVKFYSWS